MGSYTPTADSTAPTDRSTDAAAKPLDATETKQPETVISPSETHEVDANGQPKHPSTFPSPPHWPEKPLHISQCRPQLEDNAASYIAQPLIPKDQIPPGWSNDFSTYLNRDYAWNNFYGSMRWDLNERFHIPGRPKLLLYSDFDRYGTRSILLEVDGQYVVWSNNDEDTVWVPEDDPTLEEMLGHVRGDTVLPGRCWEEDSAAQLVHVAWHHRARLSGETVYQHRIL